MIQNILTQNSTGGEGISSFEVCPFSDKIIIRGTFSIDDLLEVVQIAKREKENHSKLHSVSQSWSR